MLIEIREKQALNSNQSNKFKEEGNTFYKAGNLEGALNKYKEAVTLDVRNHAAWGNMSQVFGKLGKWQEAHDTAVRCIQAKPDWHKGWYRKGKIPLPKFRLQTFFVKFINFLGISKSFNNKLTK